MRFRMPSVTVLTWLSLGLCVVTLAGAITAAPAVAAEDARVWSVALARRWGVVSLGSEPARVECADPVGAAREVRCTVWVSRPVTLVCSLADEDAPCRVNVPPPPTSPP